MSLLAQENPDLFADYSEFLLAQESQDLLADSLKLPCNDPQEGPSSKKISLTCEDYLKDNTSDERSDYHIHMC